MATPRKTAAKKVAAKKTPAKEVYTKEEFREWNENIVRIAYKYAKQFGWCSEVRSALSEAGLDEFLPDEFYIQRKRDSYDRSTWSDWEKSATEAEAKRSYDIMMAGRMQMVLDQQARTSSLTTSLSDPTANDAVLKTKIDALLEKRKELIADPAKMGYPKYRIVKRKPGMAVNAAGQIVLLDIFADTKKPAAKKTAAKKTTARRR